VVERTGSRLTQGPVDGKLPPLALAAAGNKGPS